MAATQATSDNRDFSANATEACGFSDIEEPFAMLSSVKNKQGGKSGRRGGKKKAAERTEADKQHATAAHQSPDAAAEISQGNKQEQEDRPDLETTHQISAELSSAAALPPGMEIVASAPVAPVEPSQACPQAIADAYSRYISNSLERAWALLGKLATARSPVEAFELQIEYAKQACDSFVAEIPGDRRLARTNEQTNVHAL
ncbi:putative membrane protein YccC [Bradyrhizobium sp. USDA 4463]